MAIANLPSSRRPEDPTKGIRGYVSGMASCTNYLVSCVNACGSAFHPSACEPFGLKDVIIISETSGQPVITFHDGSPAAPGPTVTKVYGGRLSDKMFSFIGVMPFVSGVVVHTTISGVNITIVGNQR